ncbi:mRNA cap guanine-N7 methyltransferase [Spiromyces aspiralis]|uniref:mRNA cap guanine-N7 methyltransferase n=1 Tax=Spiromyces aspiralis TaxID=68401 RepID=A0ACC1HQW8_9FUNG|nr:mRNA cap guanine-N7 methyltransferase [Spiromyces aspiralis]
MSEKRKIPSSRSPSPTDAHTAKRRVVVDKESHQPVSIALEVAAHYNARPQLGVEKRQESTIFHLRSFNNWIKSVLIGMHTKRDDKVLDLGCGKGGDLRKWAKAGIAELVGMDIAEISIKQARERYEAMPNARFKARFYAQDCFSISIKRTIQPQEYRANVVSMQFCMHYAFETERKARTMLQNVTEHLEVGGAFIGTIPDAYWLVKKLRSLKGNELEFGNSVYKVRFEQKDRWPVFGHMYWFTLHDAIDDCPEYLVHFPTFRRLATEYGLELLYRIPLHQYYVDALRRDPQYIELLYRMGVIDRDGKGPSIDEWEVSGLYLAFAFKKVREWVPDTTTS